jgi:hypothetical protein
MSEQMETAKARTGSARVATDPSSGGPVPGAAWWSIALGLLGVIPVGVFSIASASVGIRVRRRLRGDLGTGIATTGLVLGVLGMGWSALIWGLVYTIKRCGFKFPQPDAPSWCDSNVMQYVIAGVGWLVEAGPAPAVRRDGRDEW